MSYEDPSKPLLPSNNITYEFKDKITLSPIDNEQRTFENQMKVPEYIDEKENSVVSQQGFSVQAPITQIPIQPQMQLPITQVRMPLIQPSTFQQQQPQYIPVQNQVPMQVFYQQQPIIQPIVHTDFSRSSVSYQDSSTQKEEERALLFLIIGVLLFFIGKFNL